MSDIDIRALEANFELWQRDRGSGLEPHEAFEFYSIEQILKDSELSDEEVRYGMFGGGDDGGIDGFYFFIDRNLVTDESEIPDNAQTADLYIIQSKNSRSFTETAILKIQGFVKDLLSYEKDPSSFTYLKPDVQEAIKRFRDSYDKILGQHHELFVKFFYVTKSGDDPNPKVLDRIESLKETVAEKLSAANISFDLLGAKQLLQTSRSALNKILPLKVTQYSTTEDGSLVCFVSLSDYAGFLTSEDGSLRRFLFEPNVRAYQGKNNQVNSNIRRTLESKDDIEFWWLNNGVTILATDAPISGNTVRIKQPEIVNGLQTSQEIFSYFRDRKVLEKDDRKLLVRVIVQTDEATRNKIIKATNFQTVIQPISLRAGEQIHFDIEDRLKLYNLFYDRRKGYYKGERKPISQIVSIVDVIRAVVAIYLQQPDVSRGRPQGFVKEEENYRKVFNEAYSIDLYTVCVHLDRQVAGFLLTKKDYEQYVLSDMRYYIDLVVCCMLVKKTEPSKEEIASLLQDVLCPISEEILSEAFNLVREAYEAQGKGHAGSKNPVMRDDVLRRIKEIFI